MTSTPAVTLTENGAKTFDQTGSKVLDLFSRGGAYRTRSEQDTLKLILDAIDENSLLGLKTLFYLRDIRQGQGERRIFRVALKWLADECETVFAKNLGNIVEFGRWDDLFEAFDTASEDVMIAYVKAQLGADVRQPDDGKLSLLAKWMPSINTSSKDTRYLAHRFAKAFKITPAKYRKTLSNLRSRLNVVEKLMSAGDWADIEFSHVPSKANLLYRKAFSRQQADRYTAFIKSVQKGETKINAGTIYPYEIVRDVASGASQPDTLNALWSALPDYLVDNPHNGLVMADVSGSMMSGHGSIAPIWVSVSLAMYFAQRNTGIFKDHFMTFSDSPELVRIKSKNIVSAYNEISRANWSMSTNLQSAFDKILSTAVGAGIPKEDMPSVLYIVSDMEFDVATRDNSKTNFEAIKDKYKKAGYTLPNIVFWNVSARNDQSAAKKNDKGVALVSGCSPSIFKTAIGGKTITPYAVMLETINNERYNSVVV